MQQSTPANQSRFDTYPRQSRREEFLTAGKLWFRGLSLEHGTSNRPISRRHPKLLKPQAVP